MAMFPADSLGFLPALGGSFCSRLGRGKGLIVAPTGRIGAGHPAPIPFDHGSQGDSWELRVFWKAQAAFNGVSERPAFASYGAAVFAGAKTDTGGSVFQYDLRWMD